MTNTDTADLQATATQVAELARAGSEVVRVTVTPPRRRRRSAHPRALDAMGCDVPLWAISISTATASRRAPDCARALAKYRINSGQCRAGRQAREQFRP